MQYFSWDGVVIVTGIIHGSNPSPDFISVSMPFDNREYCIGNKTMNNHDLYYVLKVFAAFGLIQWHLFWRFVTLYAFLKRAMSIRASNT